MLSCPRKKTVSNEVQLQNIYGNPRGSNGSLGQNKTEESAQWSTSGSRIMLHIAVLTYLAASIAFVWGMFVKIPGLVVNRIVQALCEPDGKFQMDSPDPSSVSFSEALSYAAHLVSRYSFVTITIGFGPLSFNQAKLTDAAWDIVAGRLGQVILAYLSYKVLVESLLSAMETTPIPHRMFAELSLSGASSGWWVFRIITLAPSSQLWKIWKLRLFLMAFTSTYVLAFPTLVSLMTGYTTSYKEFMDVEGDLILFNDTSFPSIYYVIEEGHKIGLPDDSHMWLRPSVPLPTDDDNEWECGFVETNATFDCSDDLASSLWNEVTRHFDCKDSLAGDCNIFAWPNGINTTLSLTPESDKFTVSYIFNGDDEDLFAYNEQVYNVTYLQAHGKCQPNDKYYWGFSYTLVCICAIFNLLWGLAMYGLWITSSRFIGMRAGYGPYRAAMDLATVSEKACVEHLKSMSNSEIIKRLDEGNAAIVLAESGAEPILWNRRVFYRNSARASRWRNGWFVLKNVSSS